MVGVVSLHWRILTHFLKNDTCLVEADVTVHGAAEGPCDSGEKNTPMEAKVIIHKNAERSSEADVKSTLIRLSLKKPLCCFFFVSQCFAIVTRQQQSLMGTSVWVFDLSCNYFEKYKARSCHTLIVNLHILFIALIQLYYIVVYKILILRGIGRLQIIIRT